MYASIHFTRPTVKTLIERLQAAYAKADLPLVRRISALLDVAREKEVVQVADKYGVTRQTIYDWLSAFVTCGVDSLVYHRSPGRKPQLTQEQKERLVQVVDAGPEAAGFGTACWTSVLIQQLILLARLRQVPYEDFLRERKQLNAVEQWTASRHRFRHKRASFFRQLEDRWTALSAAV